MEKLRKKEGITLVSLVVTIIVLIILAGLSINLILGQDGIITKARQAKENIELAQIEEEIELNELYEQIELEGANIGSSSYDAIAKLVEFKTKIATAITDKGVKTSSTDTADIMANNIRSIEGASSADKISYNNTNSGLTSSNVQEAVDELTSKVNIIENDITYSTQEEVVATWIDGSSVYRKCYEVTITGTNQTIDSQTFIDGNSKILYTLGCVGLMPLGLVANSDATAIHNYANLSLNNSNNLMYRGVATGEGRFIVYYIK